MDTYYPDPKDLDAMLSDLLLHIKLYHGEKSLCNQMSNNLSNINQNIQNFLIQTPKGHYQKGHQNC